MKPSMPIFGAVLFVELLTAGSSGTSDRRSGPEKVIWHYLDSEFASAASDPTYWHRRWNLDFALEREKVRIGRPYSSYYLAVHGLEAFVGGAGLVESASLGSTTYPIFGSGKLVGAIDVNEDSLYFQGRHLVGSVVDSIATYHTERGDSVAMVVGHAIGGLIVIRASGQSALRALPFGGAQRFVNQLDRDGMIAYDRACALLRPEAKKWLDRNHPTDTKPKK
jgi:hypothetical protein